ncbi:PilN domain-containing protein [Fundidesulfovibrio soli]|uniref:PilN domain-containing protein n=1 Tax=Fundidesulfovibrio soli TaxID=2922716 RepID=UPI001FAEDFEC|nr:PilN domain-containing protein [Fundidesulfovibrio soli]
MHVTALVALVAPDHVALLRLSRHPRGLEFGGYAQAELPDDAGPAEIARAIHQLAQTNGMLQETLALALDASRAVFRRLYLPFTQRAKIGSVLGHLMESGLPDPADTQLTTFTETPLHGPGKTVIAAAIDRDFVEDLVASLLEEGFETTLVSLDIAGEDAALSEDAPQAHPPGLTLLPFGRYVDILLRCDGQPLFWRRVPVEDCSPEDTARTLAEEIRLGALTVVASGYDAVETASVGRPHGEEPPECCLRAVRLALDGLEPHRITFPKAFHENPALRELGCKALGLYGVGRMALGLCPGMDFLHPGSRPAIGRKSLKRMLTLVGGAAALLAFSAILTAVLGQSRKADALNDLRAQTNSIISSALPEAPANLGVDQKLSIMRRMANEREQEELNFAAGKASVALPVLAALHRNIPANLGVKLMRLSFDDGHISIDAQAKDFNAVEEIKRKLIASKVFKEVDIKGVKPTQDKTGVEFRMDMNVAQRPGAAGAQ